MKMGVTGLVLLGSLAAGMAGAADTPKPSPEAMAKAQEAYIAAINAKDLQAILALYADGAVVEDPAGSPPKRGKEIEAFYAGVVKGTPKLEIVTVNPSTGDSSAMYFQVKAGPVTIDVIDVMTFNAAGKITTMRAYVKGPAAPKP
jgi:steroid delta-isomerase